MLLRHALAAVAIPLLLASGLTTSASAIERHETITPRSTMAIDTWEVPGTWPVEPVGKAVVTVKSITIDGVPDQSKTYDVKFFRSG